MSVGLGKFSFCALV